MPARRARKPSTNWVAQATELAFAVPQVVAHRVTRLALAGPLPSPRDRREFERMISEKDAAFRESWLAMTTHAAQAQCTLAASLMQACWTPFPAGGHGRLARDVHAATQGVLDKGLAPVHRKAVANAKRLARTPLR